MRADKDFDILEMPFEGLAAYWLSIKKLLDAKKNKNLLAEEAGHTSEPFIRHLLETSLRETIPEPLARRLAGAKKARLLSDYRRKLEIMRLALYAIAAGENPRLTVVRMVSKFSTRPMDEKKVFDLAHGMIEGLKQGGADLPTLLSVDHKLACDRLMVKLLFYVITARREGCQALARFTPHVRSPYFAEGLSLAVDGFEADFLAHHLKEMRNETIVETARKMDMAMEMCLGIKSRLAYEDIYAIARAFMP
ncbi:MAG: hypothetical protein PHV85_09845 [Desulfovibrionaceae bacterium]|nr:hypothetical protein [Desulfovibrionaceae bacterium]